MSDSCIKERVLIWHSLRFPRPLAITVRHAGMIVTCIVPINVLAIEVSTSPSTDHTHPHPLKSSNGGSHNIHGKAKWQSA